MYEIIASEDFIELLKQLPIKYTHVLTRSFINIRKLPETPMENTFIDDLLEQVMED